MFQLLRYNINQTNGYVDAMIEYDLLDGKLHRVEEIIISDDVATTWVLNSMTKYLLTKLQRFINHQKLLKEVSPLWATDAERDCKIRMLDICEWNYLHMKEYPIDLICRIIILLEEHMRASLPSPQQVSYKEYEEKITDMIRTCSEYVSAIKYRKSKIA